MTGVHWRSEDSSDNLGKAGMPYYVHSVLKTEIDFDLKAEVVFDLLLRHKKDVCVY